MPTIDRNALTDLIQTAFGDLLDLVLDPHNTTALAKNALAQQLAPLAAAATLSGNKVAIEWCKGAANWLMEDLRLQRLNKERDDIGAVIGTVINLGRGFLGGLIPLAPNPAGTGSQP